MSASALLRLLRSLRTKVTADRCHWQRGCEGTGAFSPKMDVSGKQPAAQHKHEDALCSPFDTHISETLAILENAVVQGEVSLQGEEWAFSVCVYKFLHMPHAWQPDWGHGCVLVRFSLSMMLESQLRKRHPGLVSALLTYHLLLLLLWVKVIQLLLYITRMRALKAKKARNAQTLNQY